MTLALAATSGLAVGSLISLVIVWRVMFRERAKLLGAIVDMNDHALVIYHCNRADRCSKCWGSAKAAHDVALNTFEERGLLHRLSEHR